jgi:hypothetical protein
MEETGHQTYVLKRLFYVFLLLELSVCRDWVAVARERVENAAGMRRWGRAKREKHLDLNSVICTASSFFYLHRGNVKI